MNTGQSTIDSPVGAIPAFKTCPHCGRPLKTTTVTAFGRTYGNLPCWGSCGCAESDFTWAPGTDLEKRYLAAGIGRRYLHVKADTGDWPRKVMEGRSLYIVGGNGTRKTGFAAAIAMRILNTFKRDHVRYSLRFENSRDVISQLQGIFDGARNDVMDRLYSCDVLVLDDLGKEQPTEYAASMLYEIIDQRYRDLKPIIVTTNFTRGELGERLARKDRATAESIVSRLCDNVEVIDMYGDDVRVAL